MTELPYFVCPICRMSSPAHKITERTPIDPLDLATIQIRACRGKKGLPTVRTYPLLEVMADYPDCFNRIQDMALGLTHSLYNYHLITDKDLPNCHKVDKLNEQIAELQDKLETMQTEGYSKDEKAQLKEDKYYEGYGDDRKPAELEQPGMTAEQLAEYYKRIDRAKELKQKAIKERRKKILTEEPEYEPEEETEEEAYSKDEQAETEEDEYAESEKAESKEDQYYDDYGDDSN